MQAVAKLNGAKISPRKAQLVADAIRGLSVIRAQQILAVTNKHGSPILSKILSSAVANAVNNKKMAGDDLVISQLLVQSGSFLRRFHSAARGRVRPYTKRTTNITMVVSDEKMNTKKAVKEEKGEK
ncbi:MAG TPA: 50S ribosomal protein L22 [Patescibacteria group bacterium]